ncbi:hypothetical protein ES705_12166 [subsurface metagenome]
MYIFYPIWQKNYLVYGSCFSVPGLLSILCTAYFRMATDYGFRFPILGFRFMVYYQFCVPRTAEWLLITVFGSLFSVFGSLFSVFGLWFNGILWGKV